MPRNALLVQIDPSDEAVAVANDKWNCVIVRAIQRQLPDSLRVHADKETIEFTMPDDQLAEQRKSGEHGVRYVCDTPKDVVEGIIKRLDTGQPLDPDLMSFTIVAREAIPVKHAKKHRDYNRTWARRKRQQSRNPNVKTYGRFLMAEAEEAEEAKE